MLGSIRNLHESIHSLHHSMMGDSSLLVLAIRLFEQKRQERKNVGSGRNVLSERDHLPHTTSRPNLNLLVSLRNNRVTFQVTKAKNQNPKDYIPIFEHTEPNLENDASFSQDPSSNFCLHRLSSVYSDTLPRLLLKTTAQGMFVLPRPS